MARAAVLAVVAAVLTAGAAPGSAHTLETSGRVIDLAADRGRVAIGVEATSRTCDRIVVWTPGRRKTASWDARTSCPPGDQTSGGEFLVEVGLAGARAAWVEAYQGNLQDLLLWAKPLSGRRSQVAFAENGNGAGENPEGDYLGRLHGDGTLLVYGTWSVCIAYPPGAILDLPPRPPCDAATTGAEPREIVFDAELHRLGSSAPLASGPVAFTIEAARDPATGYWRAADLALVDSAVARNDSTAEIVFRTPQAGFPLVLCELPILPASWAC